MRAPLFTREDSLVLKGVGITLVIFGHRGLIDGAGAWGVLIFLILSGYGILKSVQKKGLAGYWHSRFVGVLPPYMLFATFQLALSMLAGENLNHGRVICTIIGLDFGLNVDPTMWFISYIFVCYAIFYIGWFIYERYDALRFSVALVAAFAVVAVVGLDSVIWNKGAATWLYFWAFPAGVFLGLFENRIVDNVSPAMYICVGLVSMVIVAFLYGTMHRSLNLFIYSAAGALFVFFAIQLIRGTKLAIILNDTMHFLGFYSFAMYLNEGLLIRLDPLISFSMGPVMTLALSLFIAVLWVRVVSGPVVGWIKRRIGCAS